MKSNVPIFAIAVFLAGCGQNNAPAPEPQAAVSMESASPCTQFYAPLPHGVVPDFKFHLRSDRIFTNKKGAVRRRVTLETLGGTAPEAFDSASQSLVAAGYKAKGKLKGAPEKKLAQHFVRKGQPTIALVSNVDVGKKPANPQSTGLVYFEWTVPGVKTANAPAAP